MRDLKPLKLFIKGEHHCKTVNILIFLFTEYLLWLEQNNYNFKKLREEESVFYRHNLYLIQGGGKVLLS